MPTHYKPSTALVFRDVNSMQRKFEVHDVIRNLSPEMKLNFLKFRIECIQEELDEARKAIEERDAEGVVDALIDGIVFGAGTLDLFDVNCDVAWDAVHIANISKRVGIKANRPNPFGLPDLVKPEGWKAPSHEGNHGLFTEALSSE